MARIGDKAPARLLGLLQAVGHGVELKGQLADLIAAADLGTVAVGTLAHLAHGLVQHAEAPRQHAREQQADAAGKHQHDRRDGQKIPLQGKQQLRLLGVIFIGVHRADDLAVVYDRRGRAAFECVL